MKEEIKNNLKGLPLNEALTKISSILTKKTDFQNLTRQYNQLITDKYKRLINPENFEVKENTLWDSFDYFIDHLDEQETNSVFINLFESTKKSIKILFVESTPKDVRKLQVNKEFSEIENAIRNSHDKHHGRFSLLQPVLASDSLGLTSSILRNEVDIMHFSGHAGSNGIVLNNEFNEYELFSNITIEKTFKEFKGKITCVIFNACSSAVQANIVSKYIKYVIGMDLPIRDETAILFSSAFYSFLCNASELNFEMAFSLAKAQLKETELNTPVMWVDGVKISR